MMSLVLSTLGQGLSALAIELPLTAGILLVLSLFFGFRVRIGAMIFLLFSLAARGSF